MSFPALFCEDFRPRRFAADHLSALRQVERALCWYEATRSDELIPHGNGRGGGHQKSDELPPFGYLDDFPSLHLLEVAARVLTKFSHSNPGHLTIVAQQVL